MSKKNKKSKKRVIRRPDFDPSIPKRFVKTGKVDIRQRPLFNKKSNFYDYLRVTDVEQAAPDSRGYVGLPVLTGRKLLFGSKLAELRERARLTELAMRKELLLPVLDNMGNLQEFGADTLKKQYKFSEVLASGQKLREYALNYLNNLQTSDFAQSPEYQIMLEKLSGTGGTELKGKVEEGLTTQKTSQEETEFSGRREPSEKKDRELEPEELQDRTKFQSDLEDQLETQPQIEVPLYLNYPFSFNWILSIFKWFLANVPTTGAIMSLYHLPRRRSLADQRATNVRWLLNWFLGGVASVGMYTLILMYQVYRSYGYFEPLASDLIMKDYFKFINLTVPGASINLILYMVTDLFFVLAVILSRARGYFIDSKLREVVTSLLDYIQTKSGIFAPYLAFKKGEYGATLIGYVYSFFREKEPKEEYGKDDVTYARLCYQAYYASVNARDNKIVLKYGYDYLPEYPKVKSFYINKDLSNRYVSLYESEDAVLIVCRASENDDVATMRQAIAYTTSSPRITKQQENLIKVFEKALGKVINSEKGRYKDVIFTAHSLGTILAADIMMKLEKMRRDIKFWAYFFAVPIPFHAISGLSSLIVKKRNIRKYAMLQDDSSNHIPVWPLRTNVIFFDAPFSHHESYRIKNFNTDLSEFIFKLDDKRLYDVDFSIWAYEWVIAYEDGSLVSDFV